MSMSFEAVSLTYFLTHLLRTVYGRKEMLGTFSPQAEPYTHVMFEESTPSGMLVRGSYSVKSKVPKVYNYISIYLSSCIHNLLVSIMVLVKTNKIILSLRNNCVYVIQFVDDDDKCYLENNYTFDIRKNWL